MHTFPTTLEKAELVGKGYCSDVYAWGEGRVLKLFHHWMDPAKVEREFRATHAVHAAGLPAPAVYELIELEGRCGIVFERIHGRSLFAQVQTKPWTMLKAVRQSAELHVQIHRCPCPPGLPSQREWIAGKIQVSDVSAQEKEMALRRLARLPEGTALCHGDFHPANILTTARGPIIIDWDTATCGHPMGDVACTMRLVEQAGVPSWEPLYVHLLLACTRPLIRRTYLQRYLQLHEGTYQAIRLWQAALAGAGVCRDPATIGTSRVNER